MLTVVTWKWGSLFGPEYVNTTRNMFRRHLHVPHRFVCVTDDPEGLDGGVGYYPLENLPERHSALPRCARRLTMHDPDFIEDAGLAGERVLQVDLDVVLSDDITGLVDRPEPAVFWRVGYAGVLSGSFQLYDAGALNGMWRWFSEDPAKRLASLSRPRYQASDQDVLNHWVLSGFRHGEWSDSDGFVVYFGKGYERFGGPGPAVLPPGAKVVVLGSADKHVLDNGEYRWAREHWR